MTQSQISNYAIERTPTTAPIRIHATWDGALRAERNLERRLRGRYPITSVSRDEAANFVARLDDETRAARFRRYVSRGMVSSHYRRLNPDSTVLLGWIETGQIQGLSEGIIYVDQREAQAEVALTVSPEMRRCDILKPLLARAVSELSYRGVVRCHMVLGRQDCLEARAVSELGGTVDSDAEIATISADARLRPSFAAFC
jgi:hypothetical protein